MQAQNTTRIHDPPAHMNFKFILSNHYRDHPYDNDTPLKPIHPHP